MLNVIMSQMIAARQLTAFPQPLCSSNPFFPWSLKVYYVGKLKHKSRGINFYSLADDGWNGHELNSVQGGRDLESSCFSFLITRCSALVPRWCLRWASSTQRQSRNTIRFHDQLFHYQPLHSLYRAKRQCLLLLQPQHYCPPSPIDKSILCATVSHSC